MKQETLEITNKMYYKMESSLVHLDKLSKYEIVVCLSVITYQHVIFNNSLKKGNLKNRNYDMVMEGDLFESLFFPNDGSVFG